MNQQEWIEYFELVNGRKPTPAELSQAQAAGEFILERPNIFSSNGQVTEQRPIKPAEPCNCYDATASVCPNNSNLPTSHASEKMECQKMPRLF